jgi:tRNA nucleotidyltransferase (CCA-adding enzyme)
MTVPDNLFITLPDPLLRILGIAASLAQEQNATLWLAGGVVRDLLMGIPLTHDLDIVLEGDALILAHQLATTLNGNVVAEHVPFGTATVQVPLHPLPKITIDIAMARTEHYPTPAALPVVQPATISDDLFRRDFALNALALEVVPCREGEGEGGGLSARSGVLLDRFNGWQDMQTGVLRVLHESSFQDDPTRILRGLRLAARLQMSFAPHTIALLQQALEAQLLEMTSAERIQAELCLAIQEPAPDGVLSLADVLGISPHLAAGLRWYAALPQAYTRASHRHLTNPSLVSAGLLTYPLTTEQRETLITRYRLPGDATRLLRDVAALQPLVPRLSTATIPNSVLDHMLNRFGDAALDVICCIEPSTTATIDLYQRILRSTKPVLNGHTLQQMGIAAGPQLGKLLRQLRVARLDGVVSSEEEERAWVQTYTGIE